MQGKLSWRLVANCPKIQDCQAVLSKWLFVNSADVHLDANLKQRFQSRPLAPNRRGTASTKCVIYNHPF